MRRGNKTNALWTLWACLLWSACGLGPSEPGTFAATFSWRDAPPVTEAWVHGRVEQVLPDARIQVAEAPIEPVSEGLTLAFPSVQHGGPYTVVIEVKAAPDKRARTLYFGESQPFSLRPGQRSKVEVALALTATPSTATDAHDALIIMTDNEQGYVRDRGVTLSLAPMGATRVVAANDFELRKGRREVSLAELKRDGGRYLMDWDLDRDLCTQPPCPDGRRFVFVQFLNERRYPSEVVSATVNLDRIAPDVAAASVAPSPAGVDARVVLVVNPSEPLAEPPQLVVAPDDPGFGPFTPVSGGGYVAAYRANRSTAARQELTFSVQLVDLAGNRRVRELAQRLLVDEKAPGLAWGADVVPPVVREGDPYSLSFELDEVAAEVPAVRVGSTAVDCAFDGPTRRRVYCTHVARGAEGSGDKAISIEARDVAGNASTLMAGTVLYDTLARCGDGIVAESRLETCDEGRLNANAPDAECRLDCLPRRCGDRIVDTLHGEVCDDGNRDDGDGCAKDCRSEETCANGVLDVAAGEACDDGNLLSHDGCSSACATESLTMEDLVWPSPNYGRCVYDGRLGRVLDVSASGIRELGARGGRSVAPAPPTTSTSSYAVYDAARDRVVIYTAGAIVEWDGATYEQRSEVGDLPARTWFSMAYVGARAHTLLFGGLEEQSHRNDLWAWDGHAWEELTPEDGVGPTPRAGTTMAYDPKRDRVVLFGGSRGSNGSTLLGDTWEWDGKRWHERHPTGPVPDPRSGHALAYDPVRERIVLIGGEELIVGVYWNTTVRTREVWEWDGVRWEEQTPVPVEFLNPCMVYDVARRRMVLGGVLSGNEPWIRRGTEWRQLRDRHARPQPMLGQASTYESAHARALLFGGYAEADDSFVGVGAASASNEPLFQIYHDHTWIWSGASWSTLARAGDWPPPRAHAAVAHDPFRGVSVLFGGEVGVGQPCQDECAEIAPLGDTWELSKDGWRSFIPEGESPPAGSAGEMFFDGVQKRVTLFAPSDEDTLAVWHWNGSRWTEAALAGELPRARRHFTVTYDPARQRAVLFGGEVVEQGVRIALDDTWEWDGTQFYAMRPEVTPGGRSRHAATYHATRGRVVLQGGSRKGVSASDVWEWDGATWHQLSTDTLPLEGHSMFFDPQVHAAIVTGGGNVYDDEDSVPHAQHGTQLLSFDVPPLVEGVERCNPGHDGDGDGLLGCADPDCYGRCSPACNPVWMSCDLALAHCGDGACGAAENCTLCAADCGACADLCGDFLCGASEDPWSCPGDCAR